jgi:Na+/H+ antiporter NhaA
MNILTSLFSVRSLAAGMLLAFAGILLLILIVSFRSRAKVFCQYLQAMTGIKLKPYEVAKVFRLRGRDGVREFFLDLIIKEDLKQGPIKIPGGRVGPDIDIAN